MVFIKGKEKVLKKKIPTAKTLSKEVFKKLRRRQDAQPISTVAV